MSTKTCGVFAENGETTVGGEEQRRLARRCDEFVGRRRQQFRTTTLPVWMRMVKPFPPVPMPGIGGVGITMMKRLRWLTAACAGRVITRAVQPFLRRTSGSSNTGNNAAELPRRVRVAPTACKTRDMRNFGYGADALVLRTISWSPARAGRSCADMITLAAILCRNCLGAW